LLVDQQVVGFTIMYGQARADAIDLMFDADFGGVAFSPTPEFTRSSLKELVEEALVPYLKANFVL
jgi:hypothetical protein